MTTQQYSIDIHAPATTVYRLMLDKSTYEQWVKPFDPTSEMEGTWEQGSTMYFTCKDKQGKRQGMFSEVTNNMPGKEVALRHKGVIADDAEVTEGPEAAPWVNTREIYRFEEQDGVTTVRVEQDVDEQYQDYFEATWPKALGLLKDICEAAQNK